MKSTPALFYLSSQHHLLVNQSAYEIIRPAIEFAVLSVHQDVYSLQFICPFSLDNESFFIQNGQIKDTDTACFSCVHRLKRLSGAHCSRYQPIKTTQHESFTYLETLLEKQQAQRDAELLFYMQKSESEMPDMSHKEYTALLSFFVKLNTTIEQLHRFCRFFSKRFR